MGYGSHKYGGRREKQDRSPPRTRTETMAVVRLAFVVSLVCSVCASPLARRVQKAHRQNVPPFIMDIYKHLEREGPQLRDSAAKLLKFFHAQRLGSQFHFNISSVFPSTKVRAAEVYLFAQRPGETAAYDVTSGQELTLGQAVPLDHSQWTGYKVTSLVQEWLRNPERDRAIQLAESEGLGLELYPWLAVYIDYDDHVTSLAGLRGIGQLKPHKRRSRRLSENDVTDEPSGQRRCNRSEMYVDFREMGWDDYIIAPEGYQAYKCGGVCSFPISRALSPSNHAIVQTLKHIMSPTTTDRPCCVPVSFEPLPVLYFDSDMNVILKKYADMVVKKCGCH